MRNCQQASWAAYACQFPISMEVMLPERSFTPLNVRGRLDELSMGCLRVVSWEITGELLAALQEERRCAEVDVDLDDGRVLQLRTRIVASVGVGNRVHLTLDVLGLTEDQEVQFQELLDELVQHGRIAVRSTATESAHDAWPTLASSHGA